MAKVYFLPQFDADKIQSLLPDFSGKSGVKVHFGEEGNITFIPASEFRQIVALTNNPTLIECNVLYKSPRSQADTHIELARKHGFTFAPIDILDGQMGDEKIDLPIAEGKYFPAAAIGAGIRNYNSLLVISHFKGHIANGFGGAIKNVGMGLASREGKLALHASIKHQIIPDKCVSCGQCIANCPAEAISYDENGWARIDQAVCISCSKCIGVCPSEAIAIPWNSTNTETLQERIVEYASAIVKDRQCFYINFLQNITEQCDCMSKKMSILTPDIGLLLSDDPVAIDQASYDLIIKQYPDFKKLGGARQLEYGEEFGLGRRDYELIEL